MKNKINQTFRSQLTAFASRRPTHVVFRNSPCVPVLWDGYYCVAVPLFGKKFYKFFVCTSDYLALKSCGYYWKYYSLVLLVLLKVSLKLAHFWPFLSRESIWRCMCFVSIYAVRYSTSTSTYLSLRGSLRSSVNPVWCICCSNQRI